MAARMNAIAALKSTRRICFDRLINAQRKEIRTMSGLNALKMRQEPKRGAKLAEKLKCEKSSIHYLSILSGNTQGLVWMIRRHRGLRSYTVIFWADSR